MFIIFFKQTFKLFYTCLILFLYYDIFMDLKVRCGAAPRRIRKSYAGKRRARGPRNGAGGHPTPTAGGGGAAPQRTYPYFAGSACTAIYYQFINSYNFNHLQKYFLKNKYQIWKCCKNCSLKYLFIIFS